MVEGLKLYSYWRSSAAYRVRIALNLKGLNYEQIPVHLVRGGGEQHSDEFRVVNPQKLVPVLIDGRRVIRQSIAIAEYLDETYDGEMKLLPPTARDRARVRALALMVACDIHPLNNLRVLNYLRSPLGLDETGVTGWYRHWIATGFKALEQLASRHSRDRRHLYGGRLSLADICLVPQVYNAKRFGVDMSEFPTIEAIVARCLELAAFDAARPENQPDAA